MSIASFESPVTPPVGARLAFGRVTKVVDPLSARGLIVRGDGEPIVLCAVDWFGIGNAGHDQWRRRLAEAVGTSPNRVAVHTLHQHDAPWCDFSAEDILTGKRLADHPFVGAFAHQTIDRVAEAARHSARSYRRVTRVGVGAAEVEKVASNRRILGPDERVTAMRWSKARDEELRNAPEGRIDPLVRIISLWDGEEPLAALTFYATHPQTNWGEGEVSADFVGHARSMLGDAIPGATVIHFNGAGGNIAAGKYNDGSAGMKTVLAERLADGMRRAWESTTTLAIDASDVSWSSRSHALPRARHLRRLALKLRLAWPFQKDDHRVAAAVDLAWLQRGRAGTHIQLSCLRIGPASILTLPGEPFVEYQIAAQQIQPERLVCVAGYGDYGPRYIGTELAYSQGGYETSRAASLVAPSVEGELTAVMQSLLGPA